MEEKYYENYPVGTVCLSSGISLVSFVLGIWLVYFLNPIFAAFYAVILIVDIVATFYFRCRYCCYFGKRCSTGFGVLAGWVFKKGEAKEFQNQKNLIVPFSIELIGMLAPIAVGIYLLIFQYSLLVLLIFLVYLAVSLLPGFFLRKNIYCKHCKQGQLGCPAYRKMKGEK